MLTTREVIKTFYNALLQRLKKYRGNWEQNDPTADDYIKNRPFYTDETRKETVVSKKTFTTTESDEWCVPFFFKPIIGQVYTVVWDEKLYECIAYEVGGDICIGNLNIADYGENNTGEPFFYYYRGNDDYGLCVRSAGAHTIEISTIKVVKLDKKYLPDLDLASVAKSGDYYDLNNIPVVFNDVVRYSVNQSLTANQKNVARDNIGAASNDKVVKIISQTLTDTQKAQVRNNIGAGTSDFSGNYADLTNAPKILQANWEMYNPDSNAYIANKPFGYEYELEDAMGPANIAELSSGTLDPDSGLYFKRFQHRSYADIDTINPNTGTDLYYFSVNGKSNIVKCYCFKRGRNSTQEYIGIGNASLHALYETSIPMTVYRDGDDWYDVKDTGEDWFLLHEGIFWNFYTTRPDLKITDVHRILSETFNQLDEKFIPDTIARVDNIPQSDWNQNDPEAADYVKNRPFYTGDPVETTLIPEQTVTFEDQGDGFGMANSPVNVDLVEGNAYTVIFDGETYECTCQLFGGMVPFIGSPKVWGGEDTGEPFIYVANNGQYVLAAYDTETEHTLSLSTIEREIIKLPSKYIDWDSSPFKRPILTMPVIDEYLTDEQKQEYYDAWRSGSPIVYDNGLIIGMFYSRAVGFQFVYIDSAGTLHSYGSGKWSHSGLSQDSLERLINSQIHSTRAITLHSGVDEHSEYNTATLLWINGRPAIYKTSLEPDGTTRIYNDHYLVQHGDKEIVLTSSTEGSTKKFKITVDDSGNLTATQVTT